MPNNFANRRPARNHPNRQQPKAPAAKINAIAADKTQSSETPLTNPAYRMYEGAGSQRVKPQETCKWRLDSISWESHLALPGADYQLLLSVNLVNLSDKPICFSLKCGDKEIARSHLTIGADESLTAMLSFRLLDVSQDAFLTISNEGDGDFVLKEGTLKLLALA